METVLQMIRKYTNMSVFDTSTLAVSISSSPDSSMSSFDLRKASKMTARKRLVMNMAPMTTSAT